MLALPKDETIRKTWVQQILKGRNDHKVEKDIHNNCFVCRSVSPLDFFFMMLVFVLQWLSFHCKILIMLLSQFSLTFQ